MSNPSKQRGTAFERLVADYFKAHGFPYCDRRPQRGAKDCGDLGGLPVTCEVKNVKAISLGEWAQEAEEEAENAATPGHWVVVAKRRGRGAVEEAWAVTTLAQYAELLKRAGF